MSEEKKTSVEKKGKKNEPGMVGDRDLVMDALKLICPKDFDAEAYYNLLKQTPVGDSSKQAKHENTNEILVWMQWTLADPTTRKPQTEEELSAILNRTTQVIRYHWKKQSDIRNAMKNLITERLFGPDGYALFGLSLMWKVVLGDSKALHLYMLENARREEVADKSETNRTTKLDNILQIAKQVTGNTENINLFAARYAKTAALREAK